MPWLRLQFYLLPIRVWNNCLTIKQNPDYLYCNFTYSLLGIETYSLSSNQRWIDRLQFYLLPIRDWNLLHPATAVKVLPLQFYLLPIRDWNYHAKITRTNWNNCNFTYSLLGIETTCSSLVISAIAIAILLTPY